MKVVSHLYVRFEGSGGDLSLSWPRLTLKNRPLEASDVYEAFKQVGALVLEEGEDPVQVYVLGTTYVNFIKVIEGDQLPE